MTETNKKIGQRIKKLREEIGINQQELADRLSVLRPTISQMENGKRKVTAEELIKLSEILNTSVQYLMGLEDQPKIVLQERREKMTKPQMRINVPAKNLDKFKEVLLYILGKVGSKPNIGETVIYKLLYFIDFDYYEKYEEQLIGATYIKNKHGPTPIEFRKIVEKMIKDKEIEKIKSTYFSFPQTKYLPWRKPNLSKLKANEMELIEEVLCKLSDMNAIQISEYSHNDVPWLTTENEKEIEYESVFYRTAPYSVREYSADI
jgi:transcriptional regulator with XRE-family HTH domain